MSNGLQPPEAFAGWPQEFATVLFQNASAFLRNRDYHLAKEAAQNSPTSRTLSPKCQFAAWTLHGTIQTE